MGMKSTVVKNLNPVATVSWKGGVPGTPWVDNDTVTAVHNSIIFVQSVELGEVIINLPAITPASVGQQIRVINMLGLKEDAGDITMVLGDPDDFLESQSALDFPDGFRQVFNTNKAHFWLVSDGVHRWSFHYPDSGLSQVNPA